MVALQSFNYGSCWTSRFQIWSHSKVSIMVTLQSFQFGRHIKFQIWWHAKVSSFKCDCATKFQIWSHFKVLNGYTPYFQILVWLCFVSKIVALQSFKSCTIKFDSKMVALRSFENGCTSTFRIILWQPLHFKISDLTALQGF
jgi:hypothetical protein